MPLQRQLQAVIKSLEGKHLPGCYDRSLPLDECVCGGPERNMLVEAYVEREQSLASTRFNVVSKLAVPVR